jgi:lysophospholipase L1-like esterase
MAVGVTALSWAQWLARALDLPFTNYAYDGAIVAGVRRDQLPRVRLHYDLAVLYAGVNDVRADPFDPAAYERDLDAVAATLAARATRLLMLTLPLDLGRPTCAPKPVAANAAVRRVAAGHGATIAELEDFGGWTLVLPDIVHPTALGQLEIADRAARALGAAAPLPSELADAPAQVGMRYAPTHARALLRDVTRRARERIQRP